MDILFFYFTGLFNRFFIRVPQHYAHCYVCLAFVMCLLAGLQAQENPYRHKQEYVCMCASINCPPLRYYIHFQRGEFFFLVLVKLV